MLGWILAPGSCPNCFGTGHVISAGTGAQGPAPPGAPPSHIPPGALIFFFKVEHCPKCKGSGKSEAAVVIEPNGSVKDPPPGSSLR